MSETGQPKAREPGEVDDVPLPTAFMDELRRLDRERAARELASADAVDPEIARAVESVKADGG